MAEENKTPWKNGIWYSETSKQTYMIVNGNEAKWMKMTLLDYPDSDPLMIGTWTYGEFEDAKPEIAEASGKEKYNLEMDLKFTKPYAILDANGTRMYASGGKNKVSIFKCLTDEEFERVKEERDPFSAPPNPYVVPKPGQVGKIIWISGNYISHVQCIIVTVFILMSL